MPTAAAADLFAGTAKPVSYGRDLEHTHDIWKRHKALLGNMTHLEGGSTSDLLNLATIGGHMFPTSQISPQRRQGSGLPGLAPCDRIQNSGKLRRSP